MPVQNSITRPKRVKREGCFFTGLRLVGGIAKILGGIILFGGMVGFVFILIKTAPDIMTSLQYLEEQRSAGFLLLLIITNLGFFAGMSCTGLVGIGLGFLLDLVSSESATENPIDKPSPSA
jgi:hypothetical protein